jgi:hypothetical protein
MCPKSSIISYTSRGRSIVPIFKALMIAELPDACSMLCKM